MGVVDFGRSKKGTCTHSRHVSSHRGRAFQFQGMGKGLHAAKGEPPATQPMLFPSRRRPVSGTQDSGQVGRLRCRCTEERQKAAAPRWRQIPPQAPIQGKAKKIKERTKPKCRSSFSKNSASAIILLLLGSQSLVACSLAHRMVALSAGPLRSACPLHAVQPSVPPPATKRSLAHRPAD